MHFNEHNPPSFHVRYNEFRAVMNVRTLNVMDGHLPARVRALVQEWTELHQQEIMDMWESKDFHMIEPLV